MGTVAQYRAHGYEASATKISLLFLGSEVGLTSLCGGLTAVVSSSYDTPHHGAVTELVIHDFPQSFDTGKRPAHRFSI